MVTFATGSYLVKLPPNFPFLVINAGLPSDNCYKFDCPVDLAFPYTLSKLILWMRREL
jgi:hypothetical protein